MHIHPLTLAVALFPLAVVAQTTAPADTPLKGAKALMAGWNYHVKEEAARSPNDQDPLDPAPREVSTLPPQENAARWVALAESYLRRTASSGVYLAKPTQPLPNFDIILSALPPTTAWRDLSAAILQKSFEPKTARPRELALRLLAARLGAESKLEAQTFQQIRETISRSSTTNQRDLTDLLRKAQASPEAAEEGFLQSLASYQVPGRDPSSYEQSLDVPDFVLLLGAEKARPLLVKAILSPFNYLRFSDEGATLSLAGECAVQNLDDLSRPRWELACRLGSPELFDTLLEKFGQPKKLPPPSLRRTSKSEDNSEVINKFKSALGYQILNLIIAGRETEAAQQAMNPLIAGEDGSSFLNSGVRLLSQQGRATEVAHFLHSLLQYHPNLAYWETYTEVAARADLSAECLTCLRDGLTYRKLTAREKSDIQRYLAAALLADDQVDAAIAELRKVLSASEQPRQASKLNNSGQWQAAHTLLGLGGALDRADLTEEAITALTQIEAANPDPFSESEIVTDLIAAHHWADAENVIDSAMKKTIEKLSTSESSNNFSPTVSLLSKLIDVYYATRHYADILTLINESPLWGVADLANLGEYGSEHSPLLVTATALIETGSAKKALPLIERLLLKHLGSDRAYELLIKMDPPDLEARLTTLAKSDPFEERPLIWKAEFFRRKGRLAEAEAACRAAISIDPSDGEQPAGDRLRVYSILADIREEAGDHPQAETFRGVVSAIRLAEHADVLYRAGLLKRAISLYQEALTLFSDAYCIQSRLAVRLGEEGKTTEADEHFRRAYELMPDSFGRVESHCFGCEQAFGPDRAQKIAEQVFLRLAEQPTAKPQVYYLLGYLRAEQHRPVDALSFYRKAIERDRDYLNAWKRRAEVTQELPLSLAENDEANLNLLRLDPRGKHVSASLEKLRDLKSFFELADQAVQSPAQTSARGVYPLAAAALMLKKAHLELGDEARDEQEEVGPLSRSSLVRTNYFLRLVSALVQPIETD